MSILSPMVTGKELDLAMAEATADLRKSIDVDGAALLTAVDDFFEAWTSAKFHGKLSSTAGHLTAQVDTDTDTDTRLEISPRSLHRHPTLHTGKLHVLQSI
jgi:hypothetical protein